MSSRIGRPPKENPKNIKINIRMKQEIALILQECADELKISRSDVIEKGILLVKSSLNKK